VPGINLTSIEAADRSAILKIDNYKVDLDLTTGEETFNSKAVITFSATPGSETFIDAIAKRIINATLNGAPVDVSNYDGESVFLKNLEAENTLFIEMEAIYSKTGEGLHRFVDPADGEVYLYSQHQANDCRRTFASFDQPDLKATYEFTVIAPAKWEVISNSPVTERKDLGGDKHQWTYAKTQIFSTYLTCFVAGPYYFVTDEYKGEKTIPLGLYCRKSLAEHLDAEEFFLLTKQGFAFYEKEFGLPYPFEKYDQLCVAEFNAGAMENVGCVTFREDLVIYRSKVTESLYNWRANVILHEMAHMWFGDLVTMKWWNDTWLNESFAEWAAYYTSTNATKYKNSWTEFTGARKNWAYRQDQLSSTHPIAVDMKNMEEVRTNFDGITYAKGASVLQQLVAHVGKENFFAGLKKYFAKHAWGNTVLKDLLVELEATSGRDLTAWTKTWLQTAGVNTFRPELKIADGKYSEIAVIQEVPLVPEGSKELRPHRMAVGLYDVKGGKLERRKSVELDVSGARTVIDGLAGEAVADLLLINDHDLTYGKIRFNENSIATLKKHLGDITDSLTRALCWSAAWDMHRDGELSATDYSEMVLNALGKENEASVIAAQLLNLETAVEIYSSQTNRESLRAKRSAGLFKLATEAKAGSDEQLALARGFANGATIADAPRVKDILDGKLSGLAIDTEMRWALVKSLSERGVFGAAEIDAELALDNTADGTRHAAEARAMIATSASKAETWKALTTTEMSNHIQRHMLIGINRPIQQDLYAPFVDQYFASVRKFWDENSYEVGKQFAELAFPRFAATSENLAKAEKWIADNSDASDGVMRCVKEGRDAMKRALKAQKADA
jgi:aminopeptidase N